MSWDEELSNAIFDSCSFLGLLMGALLRIHQMVGHAPPEEKRSGSQSRLRCTSVGVHVITTRCS